MARSYDLNIGARSNIVRVAALVARLGAEAPLARLTRSDGTPVWVQASAVSEIRGPLAAEAQIGGAENAVLVVGGHPVHVQEDFAAARAILEGDPPDKRG
jgi:hypothetical protein